MEDEEDHPKQPGKYVVKFCGYVTRCKHPDNEYYVKLDYYDTCDVLPLGMGKGLPGKALQTHESRFCKDLSNLTVENGLPGILCRMTRCSCLAICLRSTHTGKCVDYVFEFLWPQNRNQIILLESLLLTLKMCLPSFKFTSGAQLGDEIHVLDVGNSTPGSETSSFKILQGNRFSQTPKASKEEALHKQKLAKRKFSDLYEAKDHAVSDSDPAGYMDQIIAAEYRGMATTFFKAHTDSQMLRRQLRRALTWSVEYQLEGEKCVINTDENLHSCIERWRTFLKTSLTELPFKVHVLPSSECMDPRNTVDKSSPLLPLYFQCFVLN